MGKTLSRQDIFDAEDRPMERVEVPEWGGDVNVIAMSAAERDEFEASLVVQRGKKRDVNTQNIRAKLLIRCLVDDNRNPLFSVEDLQRLGRKSAAAMDRCFDVAQRLSGIGEKALGDLEKNSETDQSAVSLSV